jgi:hypothetical protein
MDTGTTLALAATRHSRRDVINTAVWPWFLVACATRQRAGEFSMRDLNSRLGTTPRLVQVRVEQTIMVERLVDLRSTSAHQASAIALEAMELVNRAAAELSVEIVSAPVVVNRVVTPQRWVFEVHLLSATVVAQPTDGAYARWSRCPGGLAVAMDHNGPIETLHNSYATIARARPAEMRLAPLTWEQYVTDPTRTPASENRVRVFHAVEAIR